jgi:alkylation response protein AidB-like acyl-CoA dehydrogenase
MKKAALIVLGTAMQRFGETLADQQEVLSEAADVVIDVYGAESAVLRAAHVRGASSAIAVAAARIAVNDAVGRVERAARTALAAAADGDTLRTLLAALRRVLKAAPVDTIALRRQIADQVIERGGYPFE